MKNLCKLAIIAIATMSTGCGVTLFNASNIEGAQTQIKIADDNFHVIKNVEGYASATYILGIGGLSEEDAIADMYKKVKLDKSQIIANIQVKQHVSTILGIYTRISYTAIGQVIEFDRPNDNASTSGNAIPAASSKYKAGDYYRGGAKEGVIFEVSDDGMHGKIVCYAGKAQWSTITNSDDCYDAADGMQNMNRICRKDKWESTYPAFAVCAKLGSGWYLPAIDELSTIMENSVLINETLRAHNKTAIPKNAGYWSSTEMNDTQTIALLNKYNENELKSTQLRIIAIAKF